MRSLRTVCAAVALALFAAACGKAPDRPASTPAVAPATPVTTDAIEAQAQGFSVGPVMSSRVVYVFFDPQCPHCAALWDAAKPLRGKARFVWIPVGLLGATSVSQGAALLGAADPIVAMDQHEVLLREKRGGIDASGAQDDRRAVVQKNTKLMESLGLTSVPAIVTKQPNGQVVTQEGSMQTEALARFLGL